MKAALRLEQRAVSVPEEHDDEYAQPVLAELVVEETMEVLADAPSTPLDEPKPRVEEVVLGRQRLLLRSNWRYVKPWR